MKRLLLLLALWACGCSAPPSPVASSSPAGLPSPALQLAEPARAPAEFEGVKLAALDAETLAAEGHDRLRTRPAEAALLLTAAVEKGAAYRYNLACAEALAGQVDASLYWLQEAARKDGVDPEWAGQDPDLELLRKDGRWPKMEAYLRACADYFGQQDVLRVVTVLPKGYDPAKPITVLVGMHGLGADESFVGPSFQELADRHGLAFVGLNGTRPLGPTSFSWTEDVELDHRHVQRALLSVKDRLKPGVVVLFGFSQGAQMAFEVAAAHPESYRGALAMSPGVKKQNPLEGVKPREGSKKQRFYLTAGEEEHSDTLACVRADEQWARKARAEVKSELYPGVYEHSFPPDFEKKFPEWVRWLTE